MKAMTEHDKKILDLIEEIKNKIADFETPYSYKEWEDEKRLFNELERTASKRWLEKFPYNVGNKVYTFISEYVGNIYIIKEIKDTEVILELNGENLSTVSKEKFLNRYRKWAR